MMMNDEHGMIVVRNWSSPASLCLFLDVDVVDVHLREPGRRIGCVKIGKYCCEWYSNSFSTVWNFVHSEW